MRCLSLVLAALLAAPLAVAQPDLSLSSEELPLVVETSFDSTVQLTLYNGGDAPLTFHVTTTVERPMAPGPYVARQRPDLFARDLRLAGTLSPELAGLMARAAGGEVVPVIVVLDVAFAPGTALTAGRARAQEREIAAAQEAVVRALPDAQRVKRYRHVPFLALSVDAAGLQVLAARPDIVRVYEDEALAPDLAESTALIGAPEVWAAGYTGAGTAIGILDTGVDHTHPFLADKVVEGACYSTTGNGATSLCPGGGTGEVGPEASGYCALEVEPASLCDHGTHVAGIAAGKGEAFSGVAPDADLIAVQVFSRFDAQSDCDPNPAPCARAFTSDILAGLEYVLNLQGTHDVASVNLSLGGGQYFSECADSPYQPMAATLKFANIAFVSSSGNSGYTDSVSRPSCEPDVVGVGSTEDGSSGTTVDDVSSFSNSAPFVDLLAPGQWIRSSIPRGQFAEFQGTSMAAPHVAGALAVLREVDPELSVDDAVGLLQFSGIPITDDRNGLTIPRISLDGALNVSDWLAVTPDTGVVAPGDSVVLDVAISARALPAANYTGALILETNDPDAAEVEVPVALEVEGLARFALEILSQDPASGVLVNVQPGDFNGESRGDTPFERVYERGATVSLTTLPRIGDNVFVQWESGGEVFEGRSVTLTMDQAQTWVAVFAPPNGAPIANPDTVNTAVGVGLEIDVLANDSDPEGHVLVVSAVSDPEHGTADVLEDNNVDYVPDLGFVGVETFTYTATDEFGASSTGTIVVGVGVLVDVAPGVGLPTAFGLQGAAPNPATGEVVRVYVDLPSAAEVTVAVYDLAGRQVREARSTVPAGWAQHVGVPVRGLPSGLYAYRVTAALAGGPAVATGKVSVVR